MSAMSRYERFTLVVRCHPRRLNPAVECREKYPDGRSLPEKARKLLRDAAHYRLVLQQLLRAA